MRKDEQDDDLVRSNQDATRDNGVGGGCCGGGFGGRSSGRGHGGDDGIKVIWDR